jgi:aryl-alcohol dehydrogenase-like predicted oxidoreductase
MFLAGYAMTIQDFQHTALGSLGRKVHRLGLSASYLPGRKAIYRAFDEGINFFFCYGFDFQMVHALRELSGSKREDYVLATGAYNLLWGYPSLRRTLEKRLRQLRTDYIDIFLFLGVMGKETYLGRVLEELCRLREEGRVRASGISTHDRKLAGHLAAAGALNALMMRYNAAHRGAEQDIFPYLECHNPAVINHTATCWRRLLRRPRGWPENGRLPTAGMCYRFVLSNPNVHVCLTAPSSLQQLEHNLAAVRQGPLAEEDMQFMRDFGDAVHHTKKWFMEAKGNGE